MSEKPIAIGMYISDDLNFFFDREAIKLLSEGKEVCGLFACASNKADEVLRMELKISVIEQKTETCVTDIIILHDKKIAHLIIAKNDFDEGFISPSDHVHAYGPSWRIGTTNTYILTSDSKNHESRKATIELFIKQAV